MRIGSLVFLGALAAGGYYGAVNPKVGVFVEETARLEASFVNKSALTCKYQSVDGEKTKMVVADKNSSNVVQRFLGTGCPLYVTLNDGDLK